MIGKSLGHHRKNKLADDPRSDVRRGVDMRSRRTCVIFLFAFVLVAFPALCPAQEEPQLTPEQQRQFLLSAKIIRSKQLSQGITNSYRLTLSDGTIPHDAHFQSVNERLSYKQLDRGNEPNFVDSYLYNLAAYELARLIGLDDMVPVTVERRWRGKAGALAWWFPTLMTEGKRRDKNISPPDVGAYNKSMHKVRVFSELIYDTDRWNPGNILIGTNWQVYMVDFTRAFRLYYDLKNPKELVYCSRDLFAKLRALDRNVLVEKIGNRLTDPEINGLMKRRDKIVTHFEKLIAEKGESAVLY